MENLKETRSFYEENIYGTWRSGETVTFQVHEKSLRKEIHDAQNPFASMFRLSTVDDGIDVEIKVSTGEKSTSFTVRAYLPEEEERKRFPDGCPVIICMHPIQPKHYALQKGYAVIFMDSIMIAGDNIEHQGAFYDLYPYSYYGKDQTGVLMAWAWGASKVLDAVYGGLDKVFGLNADASIVTGVSRWGKATAVCGAFEERFKMVVPTCSGAGGLALWKEKSEGKMYDLTHCGGPAEYVYGQNEPLNCLQSDAERGWFCDAFLQYHAEKDIPVEQYMLPVLAADSKRLYCIVAAWMGEDWVNAPSMWICYEEAKKRFAELGLADHILAHFHKEGHAVIEEDMEYILTEFERFFMNSPKTC
ncbi:MAG: hypothetical protein MJ114_07840 [Acetatifactor sp.]|nr:hypothetical protein [Acetatifactor sp.]